MIRTEGFTAARGDRPDVPNVLVLITDGNSNDPEATFREAYLAKAAGIHIITVGMFILISHCVFRAIAPTKRTLSNFFSVFLTMTKLLQYILQILRGHS